MAEGGRRLNLGPPVVRLPCKLVVRSANGEPLSGTRFTVERASEAMPELGYVTGTDGTAQAGLPPGATLLRFFLRDGRSQAVVLEVHNDPDATYDVTLDADRTEP